MMLGPIPIYVKELTQLDISKLYTKDGQVIAAQIVDGTESYPVLIEALGNSVILPALLANGWKLNSLPLNLSKNGVDLGSYPKAEWTADLEAQYMQDMYDMLGEPVPMQERQKMVSHDTIVGTFQPEGNYTINTREEFINYLCSIRDGVPDMDYLPLNYFVHPNARFTLKEFLDGDNSEWAGLIAKRRQMSYIRCKELIGFLKVHGLPEKFTLEDFIRTYMQWGVDGIQFQFKSKPQVYKVYNERGVDGDRRVCNQVFALVVRDGSNYKLIPPKGYTASDLKNESQVKVWDGDEDIRTMFMLTQNETAHLRSMPDGAAMCVSRYVYAPGIQWYATPDYLLEYITCSFSQFDFGGALIQTGFSFQTASGSIMPISHLVDEEAALNSAYLMALAESVIAKRHIFVDASTHNALIAEGHSEFSALMYYLITGHFKDVGSVADDLKEGRRIKETPEEEEERKDKVITVNVLERFIRGDIDDLHEEQLNAIICFIEGGSGDGELAEGLAKASGISPISIYQMFTALVACTDLTPKDINNAVKSWELGQPIVIPFEGGRAIIDGSKITIAEEIYRRYRRNLRNKYASSASYLVWVEGAIRELGDETRTGHSGFFASILPTWENKVKDLIKFIKAIYIDYVIDKLSVLKDADIHMWSERMNTYVGPFTENGERDGRLTRYYHNGGVMPAMVAAATMQAVRMGTMVFCNPMTDKLEYIYLNELKNERLSALVNLVRQKYLKPLDGRYLYCDCQSYCDHLVSQYNEEYPWLFYTTNAVVTPDRVKPRQGYAIKEYDSVASYNYSTFQDIYTSKGTTELLPTGLDAKFYTLNELQYFDRYRDLLTVGLGMEYQCHLPEYYKQCLELASAWRTYSNGTILRGFTPIKDYLWALEEEDRKPDTISDGSPVLTPVSGMPCFRINKTTRMLRFEPPVPAAKVERTVKDFFGLTPDDFDAGVRSYPELPVTDKGILVSGDNIYISTENGTKQINASDLMNLKGYPVAHLYGSKYIFRTLRGRLYYVEV